MSKLIGARGAKNKGFSNWSGSVRTNPEEFLQPRSIEEVSQVVQRAGSVRTVGAGHSFTPVAAGDDVMMNLDHLSGIVNVDRQLKRV
nr:hypothetical protein CE91St29_10310 [Corynebacterium striatum]